MVAASITSLSSHAECWRDQKTGYTQCTYVNSTPPTVMHYKGSTVSQKNPYYGKAAVNSAQAAADTRKIIVGTSAVVAGSAAEATGIGAVLGIPADVYGAYEIIDGSRGLPGHYSAAKENFQKAGTWQPAIPPTYIPRQYQRMCIAKNGSQFPC